MISRRAFVASAASSSGFVVSGCDRLHRSEGFRGVLRSAERLTMKAQRVLVDRDDLAREYSESDMSPVFRSNGTRFPDTVEYAQHVAQAFTNWRLTIDGLVRHPLSLPLAAVRSMPSRTQITRHDCVEGWSAIGKWHGVPLANLLDLAGLRQSARYIVLHCADRFGAVPYYESIDLVDALHPQTILAWAMNGALLPVPNGAPLRLRVERQLGYKHAKYVHRLQAVATLGSVYGGRGGYWEDHADYEWYAGI